MIKRGVLHLAVRDDLTVGYVKLSVRYKIPGCNQQIIVYNTDITWFLIMTKTVEYAKTKTIQHLKQFIYNFHPDIQHLIRQLEKFNKNETCRLILRNLVWINTCCLNT